MAFHVLPPRVLRSWCALWGDNRCVIHRRSFLSIRARVGSLVFAPRIVASPVRSDQQECSSIRLPCDYLAGVASGFPLRGMVHRVRPVDELIDW